MPLPKLAPSGGGGGSPIGCVVGDKPGGGLPGWVAGGGPNPGLPGRVVGGPDGRLVGGGGNGRLVGDGWVVERWAVLPGRVVEDDPGEEVR